MMRVALTYSFAALVVWVDPSHAQTAELSGANRFVQAFLGHCGQTAGQIDVVRSAAEALEYPEVPEQFRAMLAPGDPDAEFQGWVVVEPDGFQYLLGVSIASIESVRYATCTTAGPELDGDAVASALEASASLGSPSDDFSQMGQRYRVWETSPFVEGSWVILTDAGPMGLPGASLSMQAPSIQ